MALVASIAVAAGFLAQPGPSGADVTAVSGRAFGYQLTGSFFGTEQAPIGPIPIVTLPPGGSVEPITDTAPSGNAAYGPARLFSSGPITVSTQGSPGPTGSVTSSVAITTVNTSGQEPLTASGISSTCTASESGPTGSTTITNGTLQIDSGDDDPNNAIPDHAPVTVPVPTAPTVNQTFEGHIHVNGTENFRYVFNEQIVNGNNITVNAVHVYLLGPTAVVGELIIGQSVCGITATSVTTTQPTGVTTTLPAGVTTTLPAGVTTTLPAGVTTTLPAGVTTSTILNVPSPTPTTLFGSINVSALIRQIVCPILQQLAADPFLRPFIEPFLVGFGCTAA